MSKRSNILKFKTNESGMTLIEVSIGMIVLGLIMIALLPFYQSYKLQNIIDTTENNIADVELALKRHAMIFGFYPKPAERNLSYGDATYGFATAGVITNCTLDDDEVCRIAGNGNSLGTDMDGDTNADAIIKGDVPFATLGLPYLSSIDGYGNRLTYAVSEELTETDIDPTNAVPQFDNSWGIIDVINRDDLIITNDFRSADNAHFVVLSHGRNGVGAFNQSGALKRACSGTDWGRDIENCDLDSIFTNNFASTAIGINSDLSANIQNRRQAADATGATYYDDYMEFATSAVEGNWRTSGTSVSAGGVINSSVSALKIGSQKNEGGDNEIEYWGAGINDPPKAKVNITGTSRNVRAHSIFVNRLCPTGDDACNAETLIGTVDHDADPLTPDITNNFGANVFNPAILSDDGGTSGTTHSASGGINCTTGQQLKGILASEEDCEYYAPSSVKALPSCTVPGTYPRGVVGGVLICE